MTENVTNQHLTMSQQWAALADKFSPQDGVSQAETNAVMQWALKGERMHCNEHLMQEIITTQGALMNNPEYPTTLPYIFASGEEADAAVTHLRSRNDAIRGKIIEMTLPLITDEAQKAELQKLRVDVVEVKKQSDFGYVVLNIGVPDESKPAGADGKHPLKASPIAALLNTPAGKTILPNAATFAGQNWLDGLYLAGPQEIRRVLEDRANRSQNQEFKTAVAVFIAENQNTFNAANYAGAVRAKRAANDGKAAVVA